jgi:hypothetical protein
MSSAVCGALSSALLSAAIGSWVGCAWTGIAAGGAFAFSPLVWMYAVQGEVFALNNLMNALLLFLLVRYDAQPTLGRACAGAFAIGLALTNQHTIIFFCVPYAVWALLVGGRALLTPRALACLVLSGLLGLSPYAYLVLVGGEQAAWGSWGDTTSVQGFFIHLLRREYGTFRLANTAARVNAVLSNGVDRMTVHLLDGGQRSEGVSVHVEKMMNPTVRAVAVGSSVLDGAGSVWCDGVLLGRKVLTVGLRPGSQVEGEVGIADEAVETRNLAGN